MGIDGLQNTLIEIGNDVQTFIREKPLTTAVGVGAAVGAVGLGTLAVARARKKTKTKTKRGRSRDRKFISKQKHEQAYIRRKRRAGKKITRRSYKTKKNTRRKTHKRVGKTYYTKKGQPYKILSSGKARFIKKSKRRKR